jgi:transcriptional regulator with XRE-family HTH domain
MAKKVSGPNSNQRSWVARSPESWFVASHQRAASDTDVVKRRAKAADAIDAMVGQRLRERRVSLGMSLEQLADRVGVTLQHIQRYETATKRISAGRLYSLSRALSCSTDYFFADLGSEFDPLAGEVVGDSREIGDLCRAFAKINSAATRRAVTDFIRALNSQER